MQQVQGILERVAARYGITRPGPGEAAAFFGCLLAGRVVLAYGLSPLGPALLYGLWLCRRWEIPGAMGAILGMLLFCRPMPPLLWGVLTGGAAARYLGRLSPAWTGMLTRYLPLASGALASLIILKSSTFGIVTAGLNLLLTGLFGPICAQGFAALQKAQDHRRLSRNEQLSLTVLWAGGVFLASGITILGMSLPRMICCTVVLILAYYGGPVLGTVGGVAVGGCAALMGESPLMIGGLAVCGLCAALSRESGKLGCAVGFSLSSAVFIVFAQNDGSILLPILEQAAAAACLHLAPDRITGMLVPLLLTPREAEAHLPRDQRDIRRQTGSLALALFHGIKAMHGGNAAAEEGMGALARYLSRLSRREEPRLFREQRRLEALLMDRGYGDAEVSVTRDGYERRRVVLWTPPCGGKRDCIKVLRRYVGQAMGRDYALLSSPCREGRTEGRCQLEFTPGQKLAMEIAALGSVKPGMSRSGDTFLTAEVGPAQTAAVLCDGMGSGPRAKAESSAAARLLLSFRRAGLGARPMIQVVNGIMAMRDEEVFSTGDMAVFDLAEKRCELIKMSAPPTFLLRGDQAHWISGKSLPIGAVPKAAPFYARRQIQAGDYVIMTSDGISDSFSSFREMGQQLLAYLWQDPSVDVLARRILTGARERMGERADDMTVAVIRIKSL